MTPVWGVVCEWQHSRYPVFDKDREHVRGIFLAKDLLHYGNKRHDFSLTKVMREPVFGPLTKRLDHLLEDFRLSRNHLVVAVDELNCRSALSPLKMFWSALSGR